MLPEKPGGMWTSLAERNETDWEYPEQLKEYLNADETEKMRMETEHFREFIQGFKRDIDLIMKYGMKK